MDKWTYLLCMTSSWASSIHRCSQDLRRSCSRRHKSNVVVAGEECEVQRIIGLTAFDLSSSAEAQDYQADDCLTNLVMRIL